MDSKDIDSIRKAAELLINADVKAIKNAVFGANEYTDIQILEEIKYCIESRINFLMATEGFDLPNNF